MEKKIPKNKKTLAAQKRRRKKSKSQTKRLILRFSNWMRMTSTKLPEGDCSTMYLRLMKNPAIRTTKTGTDRRDSRPLTA